MIQEQYLNRLVTRKSFVNVLFCLILLMFSLISTAQSKISFEGVLLKNNGESIFCKIKLNTSSVNSIKIKSLERGEKYQPIALSKVKSISDGKDLEFLVLPIIEENISEYILVKKVATGGINLYKGKSSRGNPIFFLNTQTIQRTIQIHPKGVNSFIKNSFKECPRKEQRIYYKYTDILEALEYYNDCLFPNQSFNILEKPNNVFTFGIGYRGLYYRTNPRFSSGSYFANAQYDSEPSGGGGIFFKSYIGNRWSFQIGANYLRYKFFTNQLLNPATNLSSVDFDLKLMEVPLEVAYYFDLPFQPFVTTGYAVDFLIDPKINETPFDSKDKPTRVSAKSENLGFYFGGGIKKNIGTKAEVIFQMKYYFENIRLLTRHFDLQKFSFVTVESRLNMSRVEVSMSYVFLTRKQN